MPDSFNKQITARQERLELSQAELLTIAGSDGPSQDLPLERAYHWERTRSRQIFLTQPINGDVRNWRWAEAMNESRRIAAYLKTQHWPAGSRIVILSRNCAWWVMADLAIWMSGHVTVPLYTSLTVDSARQLIAHCDPVAVFLGSLDNPELLPAVIPAGTFCIRFPNASPDSSIDWEAIVARTEPLASKPVRHADDMATIIYTSGTTGTPKGAMHRFAAFPYFAKAVLQVTRRERHQRVLSYLPLAHIAERALTETAGLYQGWQIFFCESPATFLRDLRRARPTVFFSVPRLYSKFQAGVLAKISPRKLEFLLKIPLIGFFLRRRILRQLGLHRVRFAASGSAPIPQELLSWLRKLGLPLAEGYGTTESGITHVPPGGRYRAGRVGRAAPGVETLIASNQEILLRSPMNMLGYYKDPQATRLLLTNDGFFQTGDLGEVDSDGWLAIRGRIKEQFKTNKGKYVSPSVIETMLSVHNAIESCIVMGSGLAAPFAVAVLSAEALSQSRGGGRQALAYSLESLIAKVNASLAPHERLQFLVLTDEKWSVESGYLTPTFKLKRAALEAHYLPAVPEWEARNAALIWHTESQPAQL
jgi:long-chain acyl-CoA synthetase